MRLWNGLVITPDKVKAHREKLGFAPIPAFLTAPRPDADALGKAVSIAIQPEPKEPSMPPDNRTLSERHADTQASYIADLEQQEAETTAELHAAEIEWLARKATLEAEIADVQQTAKSYRAALSVLRPNLSPTKSIGPGAVMTIAEKVVAVTPDGSLVTEPKPLIGVNEVTLP